MAEIGQRVVECEHFGLDPVSVHLEHMLAPGNAGGFFACVAQPCIALHLLHGHSRGTQPQQKHNPAHVLGTIAAMAVAATRYRTDQADPLVVAQGVYGQSTGGCGLLDGQRGCHGEESKS